MADLPKLYTDNPGGDWLKSKLEWAQEDYQTAPSDTYRRNLGGTDVTGYFKEILNLPPNLLQDFPGAMGEEAFRESSEKLQYLQKSIQEGGYTPSPILIHVREDGQPFIVEGNHRISEAIKTGRESIPVEIKYLRGAEDAEGSLSLKRLQEIYGPPPTEPRSTALVPSAPATSAEDPPNKQTRMKTGIGALMKKGFWPGRIIGALQQGWDILSDEQKTEITEFMNKPLHELVGLPPPPDLGIGSYLRDLLGMASEEEIAESRIQARESYDERVGTEPEGGIATLEQSKEARESYDELMGITQNFEPTYENMPGEWFLVEGKAEYAEGDIGEYNHEAIVRRNVLYKLADAANDFLDADINLDDKYIDETTLEYIIGQQVEGASDPQAVMDKMGITQKEVDVVLGRGNATDYGIEELGYVRVAGNNVELSGLTGSKMRDIADGLYDAGGESVEGMTFNIEDSATTKFYKDVPFPVLSSGRMKALRDYDTSIVGMEEGGLVETSKLIPELVSKAHGGFIDKPLYSRN
jgi:hypothetical protein